MIRRGDDCCVVIRLKVSVRVRRRRVHRYVRCDGARRRCLQWQSRPIAAQHRPRLHLEMTKVRQSPPLTTHADVCAGLLTAAFHAAAAATSLASARVLLLAALTLKTDMRP